MTADFLTLAGYALIVLASAPVVALLRGPAERVLTAAVEAWADAAAGRDYN